MTGALLTRRAWGLASAVAVAHALAPLPVRAQGDPLSLGTVTVAVGAGQELLYHLPLMLASRLGYFQAEGLHVKMVDVAAGALALQAVLTGAADVASGGFEHTLRAHARKLPCQSLVLMGRAPALAMGVSLRALPRYQRLEDLAGRRIGVSSVASTTHLAASLVLGQAGLEQQDVVFLEVGSGQAAMKALRAGQVHALCHADPVMTMLEQRPGLRIVSDTRSLKATQALYGGTMPAACLYAPIAFAQKKSAQAQALVNGVVHALKWLQTAAPADIVRVMPGGSLMGEQALYLAAFGRVRETYSPDGAMHENGAATAVRALLQVSPSFESAKLDRARTYTNDFVQKARQKYYL